jgi:hypothetical protein
VARDFGRGHCLPRSGTTTLWETRSQGLGSPTRRGRSIPAAGCDGRAGAGRGQETRRPQGFPTRDCLTPERNKRGSTEAILMTSLIQFLAEKRPPLNFRMGSPPKCGFRQTRKVPAPGGRLVLTTPCDCLCEDSSCPTPGLCNIYVVLFVEYISSFRAAFLRRCRFQRMGVL